MDDAAPLGFWNSVLENGIARSIVILAEEVGGTIKRASLQSPILALVILMVTGTIFWVCFLNYDLKKKRIHLEQAKQTKFLKVKIENIDKLQN